VKKDLNGKADPYAVVTYQDQRFQTAVCKKTLEPSWEHEVYINVLEGGDNQVKIEIFDRDKLGRDETMGWSTVDVRRVSRQGELVQECDQLLGAKRGRLLWSMAFFPEEEDMKLSASVHEPSPAPGPNIAEVPAEDLVVEPKGVAEIIEEEKEKKVENDKEPKVVEQEEEDEESKEPMPPAPAAESSPSGELRCEDRYKVKSAPPLLWALAHSAVCQTIVPRCYVGLWSVVCS
jgi:Ca2+-dependent lipid-binding protein